MVEIMDAARYLIYLSYFRPIGQMTPLKLQKLLYLSQGWSYVWDDEPLFAQHFEAWQYGPVNVEVYRYFSQYGRREIPKYEGRNTISDIGSRETLEAVWDRYGGRSTFELVELTHHQFPWIRAYNRGESIRNEDIRQYFQMTY